MFLSICNISWTVANLRLFLHLVIVTPFPLATKQCIIRKHYHNTESSLCIKKSIEEWVKWSSVLTVKCWKSHALRMFVATLGKMPRFFWFFLPFVSSSSSPVPSPLPMLALLASPGANTPKPTINVVLNPRQVMVHATSAVQSGRTLKHATTRLSDT